MKYREKGINVCVVSESFFGWKEERNGVRLGRENGSQCGAGLFMYCRAVLRVYYFYELFEIVSTRRCSLLHKHRGYAVLIDCLVARYGKKSTMDSATAQYPLTMCYILILNLASVTPT